MKWVLNHLVGTMGFQSARPVLFSSHRSPKSSIFHLQPLFIVERFSILSLCATEGTNLEKQGWRKQLIIAKDVSTLKFLALACVWWLLRVRWFATITSDYYMAFSCLQRSLSGQLQVKCGSKIPLQSPSSFYTVANCFPTICVAYNCRVPTEKWGRFLMLERG